MARTKNIDHKTATIILQSARQLFLLKGFKGASINDIANNINLNKSLIYHHFESKENLWRAVQKDILRKYSKLDSVELDIKNIKLQDFIKQFVTFRFKLYADNPDIVHLTLWQRLEYSENLKGIPNSYLEFLQSQIITLQKRG